MNIKAVMTYAVKCEECGFEGPQSSSTEFAEEAAELVGFVEVAGCTFCAECASSGDKFAILTMGRELARDIAYNSVSDTWARFGVDSLGYKSLIKNLGEYGYYWNASEKAWCINE